MPQDNPDYSEAESRQLVEENAKVNAERQRPRCTCNKPAVFGMDVETCPVHNDQQAIPYAPGAAKDWRMAEQGYSQSGFELTTEPWGDGYTMTVGFIGHRQRVFFDAAGRVTHIRDAY